MQNTENFNYAYLFTEKEEKNSWPDGLNRPRFGLTWDIINKSYNTSLHEQLELSPKYLWTNKVPRRDRWHLLKYWFWDIPKLYVFPKRTSAVLFDMCVTHGTHTTVELAQKAFNQTIGRYGSRLRADGKITYAVITALGNETNKLLLYMLAERLRMLNEKLGDTPDYNIWHDRCLRLKQYLGVTDEKRRLSR